MRQHIIRSCLALLVTISAAAAAERKLRNSCESPSLPAGTAHIVIAGFDASTCFTHWLWDLGLTNALVLVYRHVSFTASWLHHCFGLLPAVLQSEDACHAAYAVSSSSEPIPVLQAA